MGSFLFLILSGYYVFTSDDCFRMTLFLILMLTTEGIICLYMYFVYVNLKKQNAFQVYLSVHFRYHFSRVIVYIGRADFYLLVLLLFFVYDVTAICVNM